MSGRVGYRFHPTDEELVDYFLKHKMNGHDSLVDEDIRFIDLCKFDPWDLPRYSAVVSNDQLWYFFCRREVKYKNTTRQRFNRSTQSGHWKPTGKERSIMSRSTNTEIGTKRTLVFYKRGTPNEVRTNWVIHEYQPKTLLPHQLIQTDFVLCKLKEKRLDKARISACDEGQSSRSGPSDNRPIEIPISQDDSERLLESLLASTCGGPNFNPVSLMQPQMHIDQGISIEDLISTDDYPVSLMQPQMHIDQGISIEDLISTDDYGNDSDRLWEVEEDPNEMADSFIVVPDEHSGEEYLYPISGNPYGHNSEEGARINRNHSSSPNSMNGVYLNEIRDMDFYETPLQSGASNLNNGHYRQMQRVQAITETLPPSTFDQSGREKTGVLQMNISSSSADSDIDSFEDISVRVVSKKLPVHTRTHKQLQPSCGNIKAEKGATPKGSLIQGKLSGASEHKVKEPRKHVGGRVQPQENHKESITVKTEQDQTTDFAKTKLRENAVATYNKTGSFIRLETSVLSQSSSPPSVYFINVLIGLVLFLAASREVLILHY